MSTVNISVLHERYCNQKKNVDYKLFKSVIEAVNKSIVDKVIKGESFDMDNNLGSIRVIQKDRVIRTSKNGKAYTSINWNASLERKAQLVKEGKLPLEYHKDQQGNIIGDNGGVEWQVYNLNETQFKFYWNRCRVKAHDKIMYPLRRIRRYHLKITKKNYKDLNRFANNEKISYK